MVNKNKVLIFALVLTIAANTLTNIFFAAESAKSVSVFSEYEVVYDILFYAVCILLLIFTSTKLLKLVNKKR